MKKTEYQEQCLIFEWSQRVRGKYPELKYLFSTLNGMKLPIGLAMKAKRGGLIRGVPDLILPVVRNGYSGLFIELKVRSNKASKEQVDFINFLNSQEYFATVAFESTEAIDFIVDYLEGHL